LISHSIFDSSGGTSGAVKSAMALLLTAEVNAAALIADKERSPWQGFTSIPCYTCRAVSLIPVQNVQQLQKAVSVFRWRMGGGLGAACSAADSCKIYLVTPYRTWILSEGCQLVPVRLDSVQSNPLYKTLSGLFRSLVGVQL